MPDTEQRPGITGELDRLKENGSFSIDELREFLGQMRGKSVEEVLGTVAQSQLLSNIGVASLGFVVLLVIGTVVPYLFGGESDDPQTAQQPDTKIEQPNELAEPAVETADTTPDVPSKPDVAAAAAAMGIDETKTAAPDENPLEDKLDDLLDGVK